MTRRIVQLMIAQQRLRGENIALNWLLHFRNDPELVAILAAADDPIRTEELFPFIAWALDRGLLLHPDLIDRNGDSIPF